MTDYIVYVIAGIQGYLFGSIVFALIVQKIMHLTRDVRKEGSGNVGANNTLRVHGKLAGAMVLVGDMLKGVAAAWIGLQLGGVIGGGIAGICAMLGHCFPVFYGFKGGKAVAVGGGIALVLVPKGFLVLVLLFVAVSAISRMVSLGSVLGAIALIAYAVVMTPPIPIYAFCVFGGALVVLKHKENIKRIIAGSESKLSY